MNTRYAVNRRVLATLEYNSLTELMFKQTTDEINRTDKHEFISQVNDVCGPPGASASRRVWAGLSSVMTRRVWPAWG